MLRITDRLLTAIDSSLRTLFSPPQAARANPASKAATGNTLTESERRLSSALMRVNHVGEICAQALYTAQALGTANPDLRRHLDAAAREETDHLAWTRERLDELGDRVSLLNPLWYAGAFGIGLLAARVGGERLSLGFVVETERQVEAHLARHMDRLPSGDTASRAIVAQMKEDEARHADDALERGGAPLPAPARGLMRLAAKVMTTVAQRI
ncbi:2-polyprenyl-3-methyl-6-methoxy-1,4-benzoquinone monooxygenase [Ottowia testudinis]|uniref:3-demethoxyubiquinol 3-hydroxylase n=1 Tax=Ottowia testudinis TaxID=2816950 RepID=A0A975H4E5_9BURK|nr:2-polyprenyl-3-methyl-6-methoxy-1,4-benzoquinone monooxygenase [Ottowia testudinis]QTD46231.1 2-polyprenyl-3-methyl-6-methoxy-1,4-benzoquinone monooxygenase [Ottowia testudinis]